MMRLLPILIFLFCIDVINAQDLQPGIYRYTKDQNQAKITYEGDMVRIVAWRNDIKLSKISANLYEDSEAGWKLEVSSKDVLFLSYQNNPKDELRLYCPENYSGNNNALFSLMWRGDRYFGLITNDARFEGEYLNKDTGGEPKVLLNRDGTGYFQRHKVAPDPIKKWGIETNYKGEVQKVAFEGNEKVILLIEYTNGEVDRMQAVIRSTPERKIFILGERVKSW